MMKKLTAPPSELKITDSGNQIEVTQAEYGMTVPTNGQDVTRGLVHYTKPGTDLLFVIVLVAGQAFGFFVQPKLVSIRFINGNRFDLEFGVFQFDGSEDNCLPFTKLGFIKSCVVFPHLLWRRQFSIDVNFWTGNICLHQTGRVSEAFDGDKLRHPRLSFCTH